MMQYDKERHNRYDRNHPGGGPAGQGDAATTHSMVGRGLGSYRAVDGLSVGHSVGCWDGRMLGCGESPL